MRNSPYVLLISVLVLIGGLVGLRMAARSSLFTVRVVEFSPAPGTLSGTTAPATTIVSDDTLRSLAAVPVGSANLFHLDLGVVRERLLSNEWIENVELRKHFPNTLAIAVRYKKPAALIKEGKSVRYVDQAGHPFGSLNLNLESDLPMLSGGHDWKGQRVKEALTLLDRWSNFKWGVPVQVSEILFDADRGFRVVVTYPISTQIRGRAVVQLGASMTPDEDELFTGSDKQLTRLSTVFQYLSQKQVYARQIFADTGKKIVVKIARRS